jgi:hypothetical protein
VPRIGSRFLGRPVFSSASDLRGGIDGSANDRSNGARKIHSGADVGVPLSIALHAVDNVIYILFMDLWLATDPNPQPRIHETAC